jgi:xylulokinase
MGLLGIDVGTTACKTVLFNENGRQIAFSSHSYRMRFPRSGWAELDPGEVWNAVQNCVSDIVKSGADLIDAIAVSSQGEGLVPTDLKGNPVGNIIVSFDNRSEEQSDSLKNAIGEDRLYRITGHLPGPMWTASKIMWLIQHTQGDASQMRFNCVGDYIVSRLGVKPMIDFSLAARTMLLDVNKKDWSQEILDAAGIRREQLPQAVSAGTPIGRVSFDIARSLGLENEPIVVAGGHDQPCVMIGSSGGKATYSTGTTETLICAMDSFNYSLKAYGLACYPHVVDGCFITLAGNFTGGNLFDWFINMFCGEEKLVSQREHFNIYDALLDELPDGPSGLISLPHFTVTGSPYNDAQSHGMIVGLGLGTTRGEVLGALLEGVTYEIRLNIEILGKLGIAVDRSSITGGSTKSAKWVQLKADVLGIPLKISDMSAAAKGAALLAGKGLGLFDRVTDIWNADDGDEYVYPRSGFVEYYRDQFEKYKRLYPALKHIYMG